MQKYWSKLSYTHSFIPDKLKKEYLPYTHNSNVKSLRKHFLHEGKFLTTAIRLTEKVLTSPSTDQLTFLRPDKRLTSVPQIRYGTTIFWNTHNPTVKMLSSTSLRDSHCMVLLFICVYTWTYKTKWIPKQSVSYMFDTYFSASPISLGKNHTQLIKFNKCPQSS